MGTKWRKEKKSKSKIHFWGTKFVKKQQEKNGEMATKLATVGTFCFKRLVTLSKTIALFGTLRRLPEKGFREFDLEKGEKRAQKHPKSVI